MSTPDHDLRVPPPWEPPVDGAEAEHLLGALAGRTGHADLPREAVGGRVGEDPPGDWTPPWPAAPTAGGGTTAGEKEA